MNSELTRGEILLMATLPPSEISQNGLRMLARLALVGLSVQPRPIEEAPKDGTGILAIYDKFESLDRFDLRRWQRREWATKLPIGWADKYGQLRLVQPTHFIPLNCLPSPRKD